MYICVCVYIYTYIDACVYIYMSLYIYHLHGCLQHLGVRVVVVELRHAPRPLQLHQAPPLFHRPLHCFFQLLFVRSPHLYTGTGVTRK